MTDFQLNGLHLPQQGSSSLNLAMALMSPVMPKIGHHLLLLFHRFLERFHQLLKRHRLTPAHERNIPCVRVASGCCTMDIQLARSTTRHGHDGHNVD